MLEKQVFAIPDESTDVVAHHLAQSDSSATTMYILICFLSWWQVKIYRDVKHHD